MINRTSFGAILSFQLCKIAAFWRVLTTQHPTALGEAWKKWHTNRLLAVLMFLLLNGKMLTYVFYVFLHFLDEPSQKYHRFACEIAKFPIQWFDFAWSVRSGKASPKTNRHFAPENTPSPKMNIVSQPSFFRRYVGYVSFREGTVTSPLLGGRVQAQSIKWS